MNARAIRVLVVEDSLTVRQRLVEALAPDPRFSVVGEAADGEQAIALCERLRPDVVTLDMVLRRALTGVDVTEHIMAYCPTPIVIVSSSLNRGEVLSTFDALAAGAVDVLDKPRGTEDAGVWERRFRETVRLASAVKVITHVRRRLRDVGPRRSSPPGGAAEPAPRRPARAPMPSRRVIAMGASTGGPGAVVEILRALRAPVPVLLTVHIGQPFALTFADWLNAVLPCIAREAVDDEPMPLPGEPLVLVAPADRHMIVDHGRIRLTRGPERHACRPSIDVLFESVADELGPAAVGCLLTGMGCDGAAGLLAMKRAGAETIAQDEATSVVFGMPREAIRLGAVDRVVPLPDIAATLTDLCGGRTRA
jgi:two-component system chemotaxis response regulator CheB